MSKLPTRFEGPRQSPGFMLWKIHFAWQRALRPVFERFDLTHIQFVLLASLCWLEQKDGVQQIQLSQHTSIDPMMTSQVVRSLEGKAFLERERDPQDARAWRLKSTAMGRTLIRKVLPQVEAADQAFFESLGAGVGRFVRDLNALEPEPR
jgi:DNA-binding MarR family transcriptional regulator